MKDAIERGLSNTTIRKVRNMETSLNLGKLFGIDVKIHWSFLLLPAWLMFSTLLSGGSPATASASILLILAVFGCVVLHEIGHALAARKFGIGTHDIVLYPIGGVASLLRIPKNPVQELVIAVAGPAVNVVIAAALFAWMAVVPLAGFTGWLIFNLAWVNVGLVVFNMIPAFPMDGGRVLRSTLAMFTSHYRATQIATSVGKVAAIGLGLLGVFGGHAMLIFIGAFVYLAATAEAKQNKAPGRYQNMSQKGNRVYFTSDITGEATATDSLPKVYADWNVDSALRWISRHASERFSVVKNGIVIGFASVSDLQHAVASGKGARPVVEVLGVR